MNDKKILLGLDPAFNTMGAALYNPETKELKLETGDFYKVIEWINANCKLTEVIAVVENPALVSTVFKAYGFISPVLNDLIKYSIWLGKLKGSPPKKTTKEDLQSRISIALKQAQNVGENKAAAKFIIQTLARNNVPIIEVSPSKRDRADKAQAKAGKAKIVIQSLSMPTKTNKTQFAELTGFTGRSSEHARDAGTLIFGRSITWAANMANIDIKKPKSYPNTANGNEYLIKRT